MNNLKEFFSYLTNQLKFWFIIKEWEHGLHLRRGKIKRQLSFGMYFKIPFLDNVYAQPKRIQEITISQVNFTTKDDKSITASAAIFYKILNIREYYNGYAEPNAIIACTINNEISKYFLSIDYKDFNQEDLEETVYNQLSGIKGKGFCFENVKLISFSHARTYRIIKDNLYSQNTNNLDEQLY